MQCFKVLLLCLLHSTSLGSVHGVALIRGRYVACAHVRARLNHIVGAQVWSRAEQDKEESIGRGSVYC